jgi:hypothetical protein
VLVCWDEHITERVGTPKLGRVCKEPVGYRPAIRSTSTGPVGAYGLSTPRARRPFSRPRLCYVLRRAVLTPSATAPIISRIPISAAPGASSVVPK